LAKLSLAGLLHELREWEEAKRRYEEVIAGDTLMATNDRAQETCGRRVAW